MSAGGDAGTAHRAFIPQRPCSNSAVSDYVLRQKSQLEAVERTQTQELNTGRS